MSLTGIQQRQRLLRLHINTGEVIWGKIMGQEVSRLISILLILAVMGTFSVLAIGVWKGSVVIEFPRGSPLVFSEQFGNSTVTIDRETFKALSILYQSRQDEWVVCLQGTKNINGYTITGLSTTKIIRSTEDSVVFEECSTSSFGSIHNHLHGSCLPSLADAYNFGSSNQQQLMGIMCRADYVAFYSPDNLAKPLKVDVR